MRRTCAVLGPNLVPYHEWNLREPQLKDYEGWRILDNTTMTPMEAWFTDLGGTGRHLDPIIDDPRLKHSQRVCRLYRWALKELQSYIVKAHPGKFNLACKVVRGRFEKYRYVTDPAMCDMMVRETQKYLRDTANPMLMRKDHRNPGACQNQTNPMWHPDNCLVYDHWTPVEVMWYDDAKLHRYSAHHPMNNGTYELFDRFGDSHEFPAGTQMLIMAVTVIWFTYLGLVMIGFFFDDTMDDPWFEECNKHFDWNLRQSIEAEERNRRNYNVTSILGHNWDLVMGSVNQKHGYFKHWPAHLTKARMNHTPDPCYTLPPKE